MANRVLGLTTRAYALTFVFPHRAAESVAFVTHSKGVILFTSKDFLVCIFIEASSSSHCPLALSQSGATDIVATTRPST